MKEKALKSEQIWLLERAEKGFTSQLKVPINLVGEVSMAMVRGLEKRGLIAENITTGIFRITESGRAAILKEKKKEDKFSI